MQTAYVRCVASAASCPPATLPLCARVHARVRKRVHLASSRLIGCVKCRPELACSCDVPLFKQSAGSVLPQVLLTFSLPPNSSWT